MVRFVWGPPSCSGVPSSFIQQQQQRTLPGPSLPEAYDAAYDLLSLSVTASPVIQKTSCLVPNDTRMYLPMTRVQPHSIVGTSGHCGTPSDSAIKSHAHYDFPSAIPFRLPSPLPITVRHCTFLSGRLKFVVQVRSWILCVTATSCKPSLSPRGFHPGIQWRLCIGRLAGSQDWEEIGLSCHISGCVGTCWGFLLLLHTLLSLCPPVDVLKLHSKSCRKLLPVPISANPSLEELGEAAPHLSLGSSSSLSLKAIVSGVSSPR